MIFWQKCADARNKGRTVSHGLATEHTQTVAAGCVDSKRSVCVDRRCKLSKCLNVRGTVFGWICVCAIITIEKTFFSPTNATEHLPFARLPQSRWLHLLPPVSDFVKAKNPNSDKKNLS